MKKLNFLSLLIVITLLLSSCTGSGLKTLVYEAEDEGFKMTISLVTDGDRVFKQINRGELEYFMLDVENKDEAEELLKPMAEALQGLKGIDYKLDFSEETVVEELTIDFEETDVENYSKISTPLMQWDGEEVKLVEVKELLENQGFKEKK